MSHLAWERKVSWLNHSKNKHLKGICWSTDYLSRPPLSRILDFNDNDDDDDADNDSEMREKKQRKMNK